MAGHDKITPEGEKFFKQLEELTKLQVRVGYQKGETIQSGVDLADVAMFNELGAGSSPARPFLRQSVEKNTSTIKKMCEIQMKIVAEGRATPQQALQALGVMQKGLIQNEIVTGGFAANAESTIKKKKSAQPLIDTGQMRNSVNFVVKKKGEE